MSKSRGWQLLWIVLATMAPAITPTPSAYAQPARSEAPPERILVRNDSGEERFMVLADAERLVYTAENSAETGLSSSLTSPWALGLFAFGLVGQLLFFGRFFVQWLVSEREGRSVVPLSFWWLSLSGGFVLLIYFILRLEPIGVIGQASGFIIYLRNIALIKREQGRVIE